MSKAAIIFHSACQIRDQVVASGTALDDYENIRNQELLFMRRRRADIRRKGIAEKLHMKRKPLRRVGYAD
jgi:hypothetical protein